MPKSTPARKKYTTAGCVVGKNISYDDIYMYICSSKYIFFKFQLSLHYYDVSIVANR